MLFRSLRENLSGVPKKVKIEDLPENQRPTGLKPVSKMFTDIVKMIAYRAETALVALIIPHLRKKADARALIRELLVTSADLQPDFDADTLTVRVHHMAYAVHDAAVSQLFVKLNESEFRHPQNGMLMRYELV